MDTIKPDQERVKNLLLDTVTLLCKNSLQYTNHLRVEGLLGVAVDDNDTFFLHISEHFKSDAYLERLAAEKEKEEQEKREEEEREAQLREQERAALEDSQVKLVNIKKESEDNSNEDDLVITGTSGLQTPGSVAHPANVIAGQRRAARRPHSPSSTNRSLGAPLHSDLDDSSFQEGEYLQSDSGDGSFSQYPENQSIKDEQWDEGPPSKRQAVSISSPWPNLSNIEGMGSQGDGQFQDSGSEHFPGGGGDLSQPGCSAWPTNVTPGSETKTKRKGRKVPQSGMVAAGMLDRGVQGLGGGSIGKSRKQYECVLCGLVFSEAFRLKRHSLTHTGEKNFPCQLCDARFARKDHLKRHLDKKHGLKQLPNLDAETQMHMAMQSQVEANINLASESGLHLTSKPGSLLAHQSDLLMSDVAMQAQQMSGFHEQLLSSAVGHMSDPLQVAISKAGVHLGDHGV